MQSMRDRLQFTIGDAKIPFCVGDALVIELVNDKRQTSILSGFLLPTRPETSYQYQSYTGENGLISHN